MQLSYNNILMSNDKGTISFYNILVYINYNFNISHISLIL